MRPTNQSLMRDLIRDTIADYRAAVRDHCAANPLTDYAAKCRAEVSRMFPLRHSARIDQFGMPVL